MMTSATTLDKPVAPLTWRALLDALRRSWAMNRPLTIVGVAMLLTLAAATAGLVLDPRVITGQPAWLKPAKFAISITIYSFTLVWLLGFVRGHGRLVGLVSWATTIALIVEMIVIVLQVVRGTTSHFNVATPLDAALWGTMAGFIVVVWLMALLAAALLLVQRLPDPVLAWALRLGIVVSVAGMTSGLFMTTSPTPEQRAAARAGQGMPISGAHSVGVPDGGPGLPVVGWSTTGGDLRVGHFVGIHGLQVLPVAGWLLSRAPAAGRLRRGHRVSLVWLTGLGYLGLFALVLWQALRGQPLVAPDTPTLLALAGLLGATTVAAGGVVVHGRRRAQPLRGYDGPMSLPG
jgi:hypothetical protein